MIKLSGSASDIYRLRNELESDDSIRITDQGEETRKDSFGMEPLSYLMVVFGGHLAASLAHDGIKYLFEKYKLSDKSIKASEKKEDEEDKDEI